MSDETLVTIYRGPRSWVLEMLDGLETENMFDLAVAREARDRDDRMRAASGASPDGDDDDLRPHHVVVESSDYASFAEHVMLNFAGLVRRVGPEHVHVHNPPTQVQEQLERSFPTTLQTYEYPRVDAAALVKLDSSFEDRIVGQGAVKDLLLAGLYPLTLPSRHRPIVLMFYGPSGVGKTETATLVNDLLGGDLFRKQFSMFHSDKFASYLFGGMVSEPSLAHDLLDRESGVILIDEFDKANPVFHSAFYQLFESGTFEDKNYSVDVGPALIICTSNYDSSAAVTEALGDALASRFDAVIGFADLGQSHLLELIRRIVADRLGKLQNSERLALADVDLVSKLAPLSTERGNVRRLTSVVDQFISIYLVRALLARERQRAVDEKDDPLEEAS